MSTIPQFQCVYCSSEEENHPFQYLFRTDIVSGWVSGPNPQYPIDSVIDLKGKFILTGLEIASHQYLIPKRVDLYGTRSESLDQNCIWESIGFFTFNSNQRSQWQARELKRIKIDNCRYRFLRFSFQECHQAPPNYYSQVSIISLEIQGRPDIRPKMTSLDDMIADITNAKLAAVAEENYGAAADYKEQLDNISAHRDEISELFKQKEEALKNEQYLVVDSIINKVLSIAIPSLYDEKETEIPDQFTPAESTPQNEHAPESTPESESETHSHDPSSFFLTEFKDDTKVILPSEGSQELVTLDDLPPQPPQTTLEPPPPKKKQPTTKGKMIKEQLPKTKPPQRHQVPNFSKDPPKKDDPDPLSDENRALAEPLITLFGESVVSMAFSSSWSCKVNGFQKLCELINGLKTSKDKISAFKAMIPLIRLRFSDGLKAVYCSGVENTMQLIESIQLPSSEFSAFIHQILPLVIIKLGDSNQRIDETANNFALWSIERDKYAFQEVSQYALKQPAQNQYHLWLAKLKLIKVLVEKYGLDQGGKVPSADVMKIIVPCLGSRKADVRQNAFELLLQIYPIMGDKVDKYMMNVPRLVREEFNSKKQK